MTIHRDATKYLEQVPPDRSRRFRELHELILKLFPKAVVELKHKMPIYSVGEGWVGLANQKHYISLYTCGYHHIEPFKKKHPKIKTGKGCINFRDGDNLPIDDIRTVVRHAIEHPKPE